MPSCLAIMRVVHIIMFTEFTYGEQMHLSCLFYLYLEVIFVTVQCFFCNFIWEKKEN